MSVISVDTPSQRVQFILGTEDDDEEHIPHDLFTELDEICWREGEDAEWRESRKSKEETPKRYPNTFLVKEGEGLCLTFYHKILKHIQGLSWWLSWLRFQCFQCCGSGCCFSEEFLHAMGMPKNKQPTSPQTPQKTYIQESPLWCRIWFQWCGLEPWFGAVG